MKRRIQQDSYDLGDLAAFGSAENKSGYSSKMECDYFGDLNESFTKMNTSAEENDQTCLDQFCSFKRKRNPSIEGEDKFNKLPDEMILMILEWLPMECLVRSMLVCKRWCQLARDKALWVRIYWSNKVLKEGILGHILPRGVRNLTLIEGNIADPVFCEGSEVLSDSYISKLEYLKLIKVSISPVGLAALLSKCKYLKVLCLERYILNRDCCRLISQNTELEKLNLDDCGNIDIRCIMELLKLKCLTALDLSYTEISDPIFYEGSEVFSDSYISKLEYLNLFDIIRSPVGLTALLSKCKYLKVLCMERCIVNRDCCRLISQNTELEKLNLDDCGNIDIGCIMDFMKLKCLTALILAITEISGPIFYEGSEVFSDSYISKLEYLEIQNTVSESSWLSPVGLAALLSKCKYLKILSLYLCTVNRDCCKAIIQNTELEELCLSMCRNIDIECIMDLTKLKCLTSLRMTASLDNECMTLLCRTLPISITQLYLEDYEEVLTDDNVKDFTKSCPDIKVLHLHYCDRLTMRTVHFLLNLSKLRQLLVVDCPNIPPSGHRELARMPGLLRFDTMNLEEPILYRTFGYIAVKLKLSGYYRLQLPFREPLIV